MTNHFINLFRSAVMALLVSLLFSIPAHADGADKKIKMIGNVAEGIGAKITVGKIEEIGLVEINAFNPYD